MFVLPSPFTRVCHSNSGWMTVLLYQLIYKLTSYIERTHVHGAPLMVKGVEKQSDKEWQDK